MPSRTPEPPPSWENGWSPDTSRTPGTRRLWLAGSLALATVVACVTAIAVDGHRTDAVASPAASPPDGADDGPGLLSFPSPPATATAHRGGSRPDSGTPVGRATATGEDGGARTRTPSASPSRSGGSKGSSGGTSGGGSRPAAARESVRSVNYPDRYWHIGGGVVRLDPAGSLDSAEARRTATFTLVKGLADKACYSFATADGGYLRHRDFVLRAEHDDGSALFEKDATFCPRVSAYSGAVMLESVNYPGRFLRHRDFQVVLDPYQDSGRYRADSAFRLTDGPP